MSQSYVLFLIIIINNIVGIILAIRFYNSILIKKNTKQFKKKGSLLLIGQVAIILNIRTNELGISLIIAFIIYFSIAHLIYNGKIHIKAIASIFIVVFSITTELLTAILFSLVFGQHLQYVRDNLLYLFLGSIISKLMLMMIMELVIRFGNRKKSQVSLGPWALIISIPVISIYLCVTSVYKPIIENKFNVDSILTCMAILYINLIAFYLFDYIVWQVDENNRYRFRTKQMLMQQEQYKNILVGYDQIRMVRHDMINHLISLDGYLSEGEYDLALKYIGKLSDELDLSKKGVISNNIVVDALVNNRMFKAKRYGIYYDYEIIIPNNLKIDDMDLCVILGNALNNAIEACDRISDYHVKKEIYLNMKYKNAYLLVEMKNSYNITTVKRMDQKFISSKGFPSRNSIGNGISNMEMTIEKYGGIFEVDLMEKFFNLKIMIPDIKVDEI